MNHNALMAFFVMLVALITITITGCEEHYTPKPRGYFRIAMPEKSYAAYRPDCPLEMQVPTYSRIEVVSDGQDSCWFNLYVPKHKARIHFTYIPVGKDLTPLLEDAYNFAFKHEMKANAIKRTTYTNNDTRVFGMIYDLTGNVASPLQFYMTDSLHHFVRGSLYFQHIPNADSIAPVLEFLREDAVHLIETLQWKTEKG